MTSFLVVTLVAGSLALGAVALLLTALNRQPGRLLRACAWLLWVTMLGQAVVVFVAVRDGPKLAEPVTFFGYLVASLVVMPFALRVAAAEASRWSGAVIAVAALAMAAMVGRMQFLWSSAGG
ncbi:MAG: conserved rane protein of unknown function [Pseudonocardia sp.]|jgi:hypothetical protein|nr:conserved rane protein of unknown function [Pseudonocardia sp.]